MKRFVYAAGAILTTGVLVLIAMAIAQRDARINDMATDESNLPYANQSSSPIAIRAQDSNLVGESNSPSWSQNDSSWPPAPIIRGNDADGMPSLPSTLPRKANGFDRPEMADGGPLSLADLRPTTTSSTDPQVASSSYSPVALASYTGNEASGNAALPTEPPPRASFSGFPQAGTSGGSSVPNLPAMPALGQSPPSLAPSLPSPSVQAPSVQPPSTLGAEPKLSPFAPQQPNPLPTSPTSTSPYPSASFPSSSPSEQQSSTPPSNAPPTTLPSQGIPYASTTNAIPSLPVTTPALPTAPNKEPAPALVPAFPSLQTLPNNQGINNANNSTTGNAMRSGPGSAVSSSQLVGAPIASIAALSSAAPGTRQLEGSQNPSMQIQKRAPGEVQVGIPATFTILVRNVGNATAFDVQVVDSVPKGAKLVRTSPQAQPTSQTGLVWKLGEMAAGSEQVLTLELIPETEGELGSVASVNFAAQASVRTMSTQPKLSVKQTAEPMILGGDTMNILIEITNVGTGTARDVRLHEDVPENMRHATGSRVLELTLGDLAPGESEKVPIELTAVTAGKVRNLVRALAENATTSESAAEIEVVSPKLTISIEGASLRYLERQVTYTLSVQNGGTAIAQNVELMLYLPSGLQFNSTINQGAYIPSQHAVRWELAELAAGARAQTEVTLLPVEEGNFVLRMQSQADGVRAEPVQKPVRVEGQSELAFTIEDDNDPIETDGRTTYIIKLTNIGTRVDNNVEVVVELPEGVSVEQIDAPVDYKIGQRNVLFAPIAQMQAKDKQTIRLSVKHSREGTHVVRALVKSKLRPVAVGKEESTQVYLDR